ncbi:hypothetical protein HPB51_016774 [Rhipicephalus microplus]|uniref:Cytochrome n=1 Tax=Rhipicephalus microplus TaxID=6941 RepID=A0A9J6DVE1_RHIMP|nr:hypothetical protein HPB51_016774 [Rhipicephalus microplus]
MLLILIRKLQTFYEGRSLPAQRRQKGELDYDTVMKKLNYLDQVMNETLRLCPPGLTFVTRQAKEDFEYKGLKFKAGTCFMVPQYYIQRDPRFWSNPLEFDPER